VINESPMRGTNKPSRRGESRTCDGRRACYVIKGSMAYENHEKRIRAERRRVEMEMAELRRVALPGVSGRELAEGKALKVCQCGEETVQPRISGWVMSDGVWRCKMCKEVGH